ncbi:hypothetical protein D3C76_1518910 [compost metagenome]
MHPAPDGDLYPLGGLLGNFMVIVEQCPVHIQRQQFVFKFTHAVFLLSCLSTSLYPTILSQKDRPVSAGGGRSGRHS